MCPLQLDEIGELDELTHKQWIALSKKLGGLEVVKKILRDEKEISLRTPEIKLFDKNGRRIPPKGLTSVVCDPDMNFRLIQPRFGTADDCIDRLMRFQQMFPTSMSLAESEGKIDGLLNEIQNNKLLINLLNGIYLPIVLPRIEAKNFDYGTILGQIFLPALRKIHEVQLPDRNFYGYRKDELAGQVRIMEGSRHEQLVERMKQGIVYGIYFPNPLQGFSASASREQMSTLPESLILSGGFDAIVAQIMYLDVLARDLKTPKYNLSSLQHQHPGCSLSLFGPVGFWNGGALDIAHGDCSSGLLFLGEN